jgi:hypothetical protein
MNNNIRFKNGNYYVADSLQENSFRHLVICKNPQNISETRIVNKGVVKGRPPVDYIPISEEDALKLIRQQNMRQRQSFLGF